MTATRTPSTHLEPLPGGDWSLWRWVAVRGAGFPASLALGLAAPAASAAADHLLDAEGRASVAKTQLIDAIRAMRAGCSSDLAAKLDKARKVTSKGRVPEVTGTELDAEIVKWSEAITAVRSATVELEREFGAARAVLSRTLQAAAADPRLREAVTWQNRGALVHGFDSLLRSDPASHKSRDRQHEELVASYLYRYAAKNDTIGFFGPVGWARLEESADRIAVRPGPTLLARRATYFEQWGIDELAKVLSDDSAVREWLAPRRFGFVRLEGAIAHSPLTGRLALSPVQEAVLRGCDGTTTAHELARVLCTRLGKDLPTPAAVYGVLGDLVAKQLVAWSLEFRTTWRPERELRMRIERIGDDAVRSKCLQPLVELDAARNEVAAAAGDSEALGAALSAMESTFTRITGQKATRHAGAMSAARCLVYEDCRRDIDVTIGSKMLSELGPALGLVLSSARFLTYEAAKAYDTAFRELFGSLAKRRNKPILPLADFWFAAERLFHGTKERPVDGVSRLVEESWGRILRVAFDAPRADYRSEDIDAAVGETFAAPRPGWSLARHHSPDLMIGARNVEAIARGEYFAVLGELHAGTNTLDFALWAAQHPAPDELARAIGDDIAGPRVFPVVPKEGIRMGNVRGSRALFTPNDYEVEKGFDMSVLPRDRVLPIGDLQIHQEGDGLVVTAQEGGFRMSWSEVVAPVLSDSVVNELSFLPEMPHTPRVTIDRLVVQRETWRCAPTDLGFSEEASEVARFVGARRWARTMGMPRFVYASTSAEAKPVFVDLDSPIAANMLSKLVRRAKVAGAATVKITEMLPTLDDSWLPDAEGNQYTAELRIVAVDPRR